MNHARIMQVMTPGVARIAYDGDPAVWVRCKLRKYTTCAATGTPLLPGMVAFRPIGNQMYRGQRVADHAVRAHPTYVPEAEQ